MSTTKANKTLLAVGALGVIACAIVWYAVSFFAANGGTRSVKRTGYMITARYCKPGRLVSERSKVIRQMNMGEEREKVPLQIHDVVNDYIFTFKVKGIKTKTIYKDS